MTKRMLIDATYAEETRVAVVSGHKLEEFDFEIASKKQLKGSIYLAKITRVEPSLQAAFVDFGGNRHGFLAFPEIHPDYYRIPVGDRRHIPDEDDDYQPPPGRGRGRNANGRRDAVSDEVEGGEQEPREGDDDRGGSSLVASFDRPEISEPFESRSADDEQSAPESSESSESAEDRDESQPNPSSFDDEDRAFEPSTPLSVDPAGEAVTGAEAASDEMATSASAAEALDGGENADGERLSETAEAGEADPSEAYRSDDGKADGSGQSDETRIEQSGSPSQANGSGEAEERTVEIVGGDEAEEARQRRRFSSRHYKIQEVIKRRQIMLIQVTKEERGNKGAAVTTFLSLPGRYCVLMPNTPRGGGISRKISNPADRKRLKELLTELEVPDGMSVILRTAGIERSKAEIKRDLDYLLRLWDNIRELTLQSTAPALVYEEGNLVKRAIRDLYIREIDEVLVAGEEGYRTAKDFMRMLMPSHAKRVQPYRDPSVPLFFRFQVESQIDAIHNPVVQLRSGGYIVINQTEALVAIDVNSGRSTRERNIEETALKTNIEAAEEVARQLRLRDLGGLIVIDFIDMEDGRHDAQVERRLKEAMKIDRARIQVGRISPFGLLELSRQRLRPSLMETNFGVCPHCKGTGVIRSVESAALLVLRAVEEEGIRQRAAEIEVVLPGDVALYVLNQKRAALGDIERRYGFTVLVSADNSLIPPEFRLDRLRARQVGEEFIQPVSQERLFAETTVRAPDDFDDDDEEETEDEASQEQSSAAANGHAGDEGGSLAATGEEGDQRRRRRRRRKRRGPEGRNDVPGSADASGGDELQADDATEGAPEADADTGESDDSLAATEANADDDEAGQARRRRRGKRGGKRRLGQAETAADDADPVPEAGDDSPQTASGGAEAGDTQPALTNGHGGDGVQAVSSGGANEEAAPVPERARRPRRRRKSEVEESVEVSPELVATEDRSAEPLPGVAPDPALPAVDIAIAPPLEHQAAAAPENVAENPERAAVEQERNKDYENVNQPPPQPRKGWWQRLIS